MKTTTTSKAATFLANLNDFRREIYTDFAKTAEGCLKVAKACDETRKDLNKFGHHELAADSTVTIERNISTARRYLDRLISAIDEGMPLEDKPLYDSFGEAAADIQDAFNVDLSMLIEPRGKSVRHSSDGFAEGVAAVVARSCGIDFEKFRKYYVEYQEGTLNRLKEPKATQVRFDLGLTTSELEAARWGAEVPDEIERHAAELYPHTNGLAKNHLPDEIGELVMDIPIKTHPDFDARLSSAMERMRAAGYPIDLKATDAQPWVVAHALVDLEQAIRTTSSRMIPVIFNGDSFPTALVSEDWFSDPRIKEMQVLRTNFEGHGAIVIADYVERTQAFKPWGLALDPDENEDEDARLCDTELEYRDLAGNLADEFGVDIIDEAVLRDAYSSMTFEVDDQDWDEALDSARDILPFMTEDTLFAVVQPNSYLSAEILGNRLAELMMDFVENDREMREHIPMLVMREMISNPGIDSSSPVVKGFLDALELRPA